MFLMKLFPFLNKIKKANIDTTKKDINEVLDFVINITILNIINNMHIYIYP